MKRTLLENLLTWKDRPTRKPLLIDGARQTAKTFRLQELLGSTFENVIRIDFLESHNGAFKNNIYLRLALSD